MEKKVYTCDTCGKQAETSSNAHPYDLRLFTVYPPKESDKSHGHLCSTECVVEFAKQCNVPKK